ncbi:MAG: glycosyltransferase family 4 protein [Alphaproteobacteria bacterium]|jgi:glycosyltransferase involved in cell wall biosynthesis
MPDHAVIDEPATGTAAAPPVGERTGVLYLDVEGGWGGSSRSLYYLVEALDRSAFEPIVLLRKAGPVEERYRAIGVDCRVVPELPSFRPGDRKNAIAFMLYAWKLRKLPALLRRLAPIVAEHDIRLLHVNHESLVLTGALIARRFGLPWIGHVRTLLTPGWFARRVHRLMARSASHVFFITEPNRVHFRTLSGDRFDAARTSVVHNIIPPPKTAASPLPALTEPADRFRVLSLTNFSPSRGVDRIVDVAEALKRRGETRFAFYLCGQPAFTNALTGKVDPYYDSIVARVADAGLDGAVFFPGHVSEPERALAACDALIKLTRQANPWGRDIIEALAAGVPVLTLGSFEDFVADGVNGFIETDFDAGRMADHLVALADSPDLCRSIRAANRQKAKRLFDGEARAADVAAVYRSVLSQASVAEARA